MSLVEWAGSRVFNIVHGNNLVYNTCWEDPRLDNQALNLSADDTVLVITSAGCNALDYALAAPKKVVAVDMNPRQNALLELKIAAIKKLEFEDFFTMFGEGKIARAGDIYRDKLRGSLSHWSQDYWDRFIKFFDPANRRPFYYRGTSGAFAMMINVYVNRIVKLRPYINDLLASENIKEQREIYDRYVRDRFWTPSMRFAMRRDTVLSLVGVPQAQRAQIERQYPGGINQFLQDCIDAVFAKLPLQDNYFWRVYMTGRYTRECCPEYLKPHNFQRLKEGLASRVEIHTNSVQGYLEANEQPISRFVLLDHMDWLSGKRFALLEHEWQWIVRRAADKTRVLWRSAGLQTPFVDEARVSHQGQTRHVGELLTYDRDLAARLHPVCRVHTYGSFHIADLAA
jgi:S-adenosylmethionine-diacylglycerol 3-amino-3-carboxypropyl transferase